MLPTIGHNDQTKLAAGEIGDERADGESAMEFITGQLSATQSGP